MFDFELQVLTKDILTKDKPLTEDEVETLIRKIEGKNPGAKVTVVTSQVFIYTPVVEKGLQT